MLVEKLFLLIVLLSCLFSFYMVTISVIHFIYSDSIVEKFGIIFLDCIAIISVIFYIIFEAELFGVYKKTLADLKVDRSVYVDNHY